MSYRFIWRITVTPKKQVAFIENWCEASKVLQEYSGAKGTRLHRSIDDENTFVAIAEWESKAARDVMEADTRAGMSERAKRWQKFSRNEVFGAFEVVARMNEIEIVMPPGSNSSR